MFPINAKGSLRRVAEGAEMIPVYQFVSQAKSVGKTLFDQSIVLFHEADLFLQAAAHRGAGDAVHSRIRHADQQHGHGVQ